MGELRVLAFDSRPAGQAHCIGRYTSRLLAALRETAAEELEIVETHRPHARRSGRVQLYHSPWLAGAALRSPCPTVVTLHEIDSLTRRSECLRRGGMYTRMRHLALQRAACVIVHSEAIAEDASSKLGLEPERVTVIPSVPSHTDSGRENSAGCTGDEGNNSAWSWEDVARATWEVYERALAEPPRPFVSRPRASSARRQ